MAFFFRKSEVEKINNLLSKAKSFICYQDAYAVIEQRQQGRFIVSFLNMYAIQLCLKDDAFYNALLQADLLLMDGIALKLLCRQKKIFYGINMNGSDFIPAFIEKYCRHRYAVFASDDEAIQLFKAKHKELRIVSYLNGFYEYDRYAKEVAANEFDILLLGMGMPKQELLSLKLNSNHIIMNGGAIVDYMSGYKKRSPKFFIKLKIEWLYRIFYEPKRLFSRYAEGFWVLFRIIATDIFLMQKQRKVAQ
jgi:N-acetylglucosaminyldiphosphoundecaprenol N-acetyl-beta-D-mannosaminyltransferase